MNNEKISDKLYNMAEKYVPAALNTIKECKDDAISRIREEDYEQGFQDCLETTIKAMLEEEVERERIINLLIKYFDIPYMEAQDRLKHSISICADEKLKHFLAQSGMSEDQIKAYRKQKMVRKSVYENPYLQISAFKPQELKEKLDSI